MSFDALVLNPVRKFLHRRVEVPDGASWIVETEGDATRLVLEESASNLSRNLQEDLAATPSFLLCLAYWLERATGRPTLCELRVTGVAPKDGSELLHWRRSLFVIEQLERAVPRRLTVKSPAHWQWPNAPILNAAQTDRSNDAEAGSRPEHILETDLCQSDAARLAFSRQVAPVLQFKRQLPVGLFSGVVSKNTHFTPGNKSQVDLWTCSPDGDTLHLFELKAKGNAQVGILPELLYYVRLLHHVRTNLSIRGDDSVLQVLRATKRIVAWMVAPKVHPLVYCQGESPLVWLNDGMKEDAVEMRILPIELDQDGKWARWRVEEKWPGSPS